jgi:hypothetical protein
VQTSDKESYDSLGFFNTVFEEKNPKACGKIILDRLQSEMNSTGNNNLQESYSYTIPGVAKPGWAGKELSVIGFTVVSLCGVVGGYYGGKAGIKRLARLI